MLISDVFTVAVGDVLGPHTLPQLTIRAKTMIASKAFKRVFILPPFVIRITYTNSIKGEVTVGARNIRLF